MQNLKLGIEWILMAQIDNRNNRTLENLLRNFQEFLIFYNKY